ncbi:hypothetical protein [Nocardioides okcheonensis]|uniref:hypothetical protein n=1 Tax=Nocardioides okcheonensis TaxID=2894081 RepID=UPI001E333003|nr:hypothetical protein [Nocardioides okcheonensis]UFN45689.1 hypothetical protein LN652_05620 [Nocardioides okcheonensis]
MPPHQSHAINSVATAHNVDPEVFVAVFPQVGVLVAQVPTPVSVPRIWPVEPFDLDPFVALHPDSIAARPGEKHRAQAFRSSADPVVRGVDNQVTCTT